jgi:group I intron endonuclease
MSLRPLISGVFYFMKTIAVYKITSPIGKIYIGATINFEKRIKHYKSLDCKNQKKLYNSFIEYGFVNHNIEIIEVCKKNDLHIKESYYGILYNVLGENGLNSMLHKNIYCNKGISNDTRLLMSESKKGDKNNFYKQKHKEETKLKISLAKKGSTPHNKGIKGVYNNIKASKFVIDLENGIVYNSCKECCDYNPYYKYSALRAKLNGRVKNNTKFKYINI